MKKSIYLALSGLLMLTSCDMDINEDPNEPSASSVTIDLVFPSAENFIADCLGDQMFNYSGFFAQYWDQMPTANQYNDLAELNINESKDLFNWCYTYLYAGALEDLETIMNKTDNTATIFACKVLRAYTFQLLVDNMSDAPYSEALKGTALLNPKWDDGQTIYEGVLAELDEAEANLDSKAVMNVTDPLLSKNMDQWKGFANALRLRMLLRLIDANINAADNTAKVQKLVADNNFFTNDVAWDVYDNADGQYNPWYDAYRSLGTKNHCAAYPLVEYLKLTNDPRISYVIKPRSYDNTYVGQIPGAKTVEAGWLGLSTAQYQDTYVSNIDYSVMAAAPIYLFTQAELQLLIAEAELRFNNDDAAAKAAYEAAVSYDFKSRGISGAETFLAGVRTGWDNMSDNTAKLNLVYMQKWVALFMRDHMEAWSEARRTDIPALSSASGKDIISSPNIYNAGDFIEPAINYSEGSLAERVPYPSTARTLNPNTPTAKTLADKVFWDVK